MNGKRVRFVKRWYFEEENLVPLSPTKEHVFLVARKRGLYDMTCENLTKKRRGEKRGKKVRGWRSSGKKGDFS